MIKFESPLVGDDVVRKLRDLPKGFLSATLPINFLLNPPTEKAIPCNLE